MVQMIFKPELYKFATSAEFAGQFGLEEQDLILTNEYIFQPYFGQMGLKSAVIYQEQYGSGEPTDIMADRILADARKTGCKRVVAIGGGTIIDLAKVLAVAENETLDELYEKSANITKKRGLVIIPTTCGTGSEVTNLSIINRTRLGTKMGLASPAMYADKAVLIPELLEGLPFGVFATSSIDALVHAVESALSPKATVYTKLFSYKAIEMILKGYQVIAGQGQGARLGLLDNFLVASNYAGLAFGTAGCGTVHAMSYPFGGQYHVAHGESNYVIFSEVLKNYIKLKSDGEIACLNSFMAPILQSEPGEVYGALDKLLNKIFPRKTMREYGVKADDLPEFTRTVMEKQQRLMANSFVPLDYNQILKIYQELY
ncbi:MAG: 4-hydroxybutyrate dehydrogenase [Treponema sp.]|jgi:4-hydroxybutyrate dehydrogenase|nr:4-hydroxybutyrate dehydrogenase [Treponema sp.]